jgi:predicted transcriptional regulator
MSDFNTSVLNTIRNNKFSSVHVLAHLMKKDESDVQSALNYLLSSGQIYQSVGGVPKRYSHIDEKYTAE